jgi:hypothetical protein
MAFEPESVKSKIQKILVLAEQGSTEGEREAAQARAQEMMLRYNLSLAEIEAFSGVEDVNKVTAWEWEINSEAHFWEGDLVGIVGDYNFVRVHFRYFRRTRSKRVYVMVGRPHNIQFCLDLMNSMKNSLKSDYERAKQDAYSNGAVFRRNFYDGALYRIDQRLKVQHATRQREVIESTSGGMDLVVKEDGFLDKWYSDNGIELSTVTSKTKFDSDAWQDGSDAGSRVDISGGINEGSDREALNAG